MFGEKREINQDFVLEKSVDTLCVAENVAVDSTKLKRTYKKKDKLAPVEENTIRSDTVKRLQRVVVVVEPSPVKEKRKQVDQEKMVLR